MFYNDFQDIKLSRLGFGTMRLPLKEDGSIDQEQVEKMTDYAITHGVNYFDTAYPYHDGQSERSIGKALAKYPRESFYLATKYPGHQISKAYNPAEVFERQLKKCGVEYFDFYLLHNVYENDIQVYMDPQWGILDYFLEQKKNGRIRHLGFSSHARPDTLSRFLDYCGKHMEFCQIQMNYLDWTLQEAAEKYRILSEHNIPVWVMEPVRGGRLASLGESETKQLLSLHPEESIASWAFRWLMQFDNVKMILSGMSNTEQMEDNVKTFSSGTPLTKEEGILLLGMAEQMKNSVPCTSCRYCTSECPMGLDIPMLIKAYNDISFGPALTVSMQLDALPEDKLPNACLACGACAKVCPQSIDIPSVMASFSEKRKDFPNWKELSHQRELVALKDAQQD